MADHRRRPRAAVQADSPPNEASLHEAALNHLARFAATEAGLRRVLLRRVDRWARAAEGAGAAPEAIAPAVAEAKAAAARVARRLAAAGAVDDAAFAASRAARLSRAGRSRRAITAHLKAKGVASAVAEAALPAEEETELAAALAYCRRRRIGPFAAAPGEREARMKALAALGRAGFGRAAAEAALAMDRAAAEERILAMQRG